MGEEDREGPDAGRGEGTDRLVRGGGRGAEPLVVAYCFGEQDGTEEDEQGLDAICVV